MRDKHVKGLMLLLEYQPYKAYLSRDAPAV